MKSETTRALYQYWQSRRLGQTVPRRADINPTDIQHLLTDSFILQAERDGLIHYRLAGTRVCALLGQELKRQPYIFAWAPSHRPSVESALNIVTSDALCVLIGWRGRTNQGQHVTGETLLAPMALDDGARIERILGIISTHSTPHWLGHSPVVELDVTTLRVIDPDRVEVGGLSSGVIFTEQAGSKHSSRPINNVVHMHSTRQVKHLAVFDGGRRD